MENRLKGVREEAGNEVTASLQVRKWRSCPWMGHDEPRNEG